MANACAIRTLIKSVCVFYTSIMLLRCWCSNKHAVWQNKIPTRRLFTTRRCGDRGGPAERLHHVISVDR